VSNIVIFIFNVLSYLNAVFMMFSWALLSILLNALVRLVDNEGLIMATIVHTRAATPTNKPDVSDYIRDWHRKNLPQVSDSMDCHNCTTLLHNQNMLHHQHAL
jgi:hypothetical protein